MEKILQTQLPTYLCTRKYVHNLCDKYKFLSLATMGKSFMGKDIIALTIGEGERNIIYVGGTHGLEWVSVSTLLQFSERVAKAYENDEALSGYKIREILKKCRLVIIPVLNPDGIDLALQGVNACGDLREEIYDICKFDFSRWSANARGVDLNHNFNADWYSLRNYEEKKGINAPAPRRFGGFYPESEPETRAIVRFLREVNFERLYTFHSQGEEIFYEFKNNTPEKSFLIAKALSGVSGYTLVKNEGHYSSGGLKDWFIEEFKKPGFTVELGLGKNPLPLEDFEEIYKKIEPMLILGLIL